MHAYPVARQHLPRLAFMLTALGLTLLSDAAMAQPDESTVVAPREVTREQVGRSATIGAPIEDTIISQQIAYNDLDLKNAADVSELNNRIRDAAQYSCSELDRFFPQTRSIRVRWDCVRKTIRSANSQVDAAVASAGQGYGGRGP
jgi:UrcA family protein